MKEKTSNSWSKFPHSYIRDIIDGLKEESPWLTRNLLNHGIRNFTGASLTLDNNLEKLHVIDSSTTQRISHCNLERKTGGRPKGTTDDMKKNLADATIAVNHLQSLVAHEDLHRARAQIKRNREKGVTFREKIKMIVLKSGSTRLGQKVLDVVKSNDAKAAGVRIFETKGTDSEKWNVADLKVVLKSLKRKGDGPLPSLKKDLRALYTMRKDRAPIDLREL